MGEETMTNFEKFKTVMPGVAAMNTNQIMAAYEADIHRPVDVSKVRVSPIEAIAITIHAIGIGAIAWVLYEAATILLGW